MYHRKRNLYEANNKIVYFSNYEDPNAEDNIRDFLFNAYANDYGWESPYDIPDETIWNEMEYNQTDSIDEFYDFLKYDFDKYIKSTPFGLILWGSVAAEYGSMDGGLIIGNANDLRNLLDGYEFVEIYSENRHLYIQCSGHDGTNYGEFREITEAGDNYIDRNYYHQVSDEVLLTVFDSNKYSRLPRFHR